MGVYLIVIVILADMQWDPSSDQDRSWRTDAVGAHTYILFVRGEGGASFFAM